MKRIKFRDVPVGGRFRFASEFDYPASGMATGPWKKISPRKYSYTGAATSFLIGVRVGSINAEVIMEDSNATL